MTRNSMLEQPSMPSRPSTSLRRDWLRFSVRSLLVLVLVVGSLLGWLIYRVRAQCEAVAAIQKAGGFVVYRWKWRNGSVDRLGKPGVPGWLLQWLGPDFFYGVKRVDLVADFGDGADDRLMIRVAQLRDLEALNLHGDKDVTDVGLAHFEGLNQLRALDLSKSGVKDAGLIHLKGLTNLWYLSLDDTGVTDAGLSHLRGLSNLKVLRLNGTMVSGVGVRELAKVMPNTRIDP